MMIMGYDIGLLLDGIILVFLCVTIFYAARLSLFMKSFREGRSDMQRLIRDLSTTIDKAEASISTMKENAKGTELEIRTIINEAKFLSDELRFMNETGDSLADRLEKLADRNRELVDLMESSGGIGTQRIMPYEPSIPKKEKLPFSEIESSFEIDDFDLEVEDDDEFDFMALADGAYREEEAKSSTPKTFHESKINTQAKSKVRSFAIFDREYDEDEDDDDAHAHAHAHNDVLDEDEDKRQFHSRAEQELYEALQRKKRAYDEENPPPKRVSKVT